MSPLNVNRGIKVFYYSKYELRSRFNYTLLFMTLRNFCYYLCQQKNNTYIMAAIKNIIRQITPLIDSPSNNIIFIERNIQNLFLIKPA